MRIDLIHVPFAMRRLPSLGLTQLRSVIDADPDLDAEVEIHYAHHDFARMIGPDLYDFVAGSKDATTSGLGEWFFRQSGFPDAEDNTELYFQRYFPQNDSETRKIRDVLRLHRSNLDATIDALIDGYELERADVVGLSTMFAQTVACLAFARRIKRRNPQATIVLGGANCEAPMGQVLARKFAGAVDYVFSGPALNSFHQFVRALSEGRAADCAAVQGVFTSAQTPTQALLDGDLALGTERDINETLPLDYDGFISSVERNFSGEALDPIILFETSRGCWWGARHHCTFCGLNGSNMAFRTMHPEKALTQFDELLRYRDRAGLYNAVDNIMPHRYVDDVFAGMRADPGVSIFYEIKANIDDEQLRTLARAGVDRLQPGIEALNTSTLKLMKKGCTAFQNLALLKSCLAHRVRPVWNLLVGFPGEGADVYKKYDEDLPRLSHLPPPMGVYPVRFDRYSPYFVQAQAYGLDLAPHDFYYLTFPWADEEIRQLAYYFADRNIWADYIQAMLEWINPLRGHTSRWMQRWRDASSQGYPLLHWTDAEAGVVFDSRGVDAIEHELEPGAAQLLRRLSRPALASRLADECGGSAVAGAWLEQLDERGLVFCEEDRWMSLVLDAKPSDPGWFVI